MSRRVLRWDVQISDDVQKIGGGQVVHVDCRPDDYATGPARRVEVWTEEEIPTDMPLNRFGSLMTREVVVVGTAHVLPEGFTHLGSALEPDPQYRAVWHVYERVQHR